MKTKLNGDIARAIGKRNKLDGEGVDTFIANCERSGFKALNRLTGKIEPIRDEVHLERLLIAFCHTLEHQTN
jgi:hypothetical protein